MTSDRTPLRLLLELDRDAHVIGGVVVDEGHADRRPFSGWLGLTMALVELGAESGSPAPEAQEAGT